MSHKPDKTTRDTVVLHATVGTTQEDIARVLGIDSKTLRKHYREELDLSLIKANATVGGVLFNKAKAGNTASMIWWSKTRMGWSEKQQLEHTSPDGTMSPPGAFDATNLSSETLEELLNARIIK